MDINNAFGLLRNHPSDFELLGLKCFDKYFVDKALPMGCALSCSLFAKFCNIFGVGVKSKSGKKSVAHYLYDYIFIGAPGSEECQYLMEFFAETFSELEVPIVKKKTVGPVPIIKFVVYIQ